MQYDVNQGLLQVIIEGEEINAVVGEAAQINVGEAINYIRTGTEEIEQAVQEGITEFNGNAVEKTNEFDLNAQNKTSDFNSNATQKTLDFNSNASDKTSDFNLNAQEKTSEFNANAVEKTNDFNSNAQDKTGDFNDNAVDKTNYFNDNASDKTGDFNLNAQNKTSDFNDNYTEKKGLIDAQVVIAEGSATMATNQAGLAKQWAIGDPSEPTGNSAKYWATQASNSATAAATSEDHAEVWAEGTDQEVQALGGVHSAKGWAAESATGQINSDWTETDTSSKAYILHKPTAGANISLANNQISAVSDANPISGSTNLVQSGGVYTGLNTLQQEIDTILLSSDVYDVVGTYTDLQNYDISTVPVNDIIKVLSDSTHSDAASYYRCTESGGVKSWTYVGSEGPYYTKSEANTLLNDKANINLSNLSSAGQAVLDAKQDIATAVNYDNITNCITEIPQDIKLELNNGTLTLKSGSKVYVPNGVGVFDTVTTENDMTINVLVNSQCLIFYRPSGLGATTLAAATSGSTAPIGTGWWYDTTNNLVKRYVDGSQEGSNGSLPLALITSDGTSITSIDQVFNGFGYIGKTVFALPGVKGLMPNGRNEDGTLKNLEFATRGVLTLTGNGNFKGVGIYINATYLQYYGRQYFVANELSDIPSNFGGVGYIISENMLYTFSNGKIQNKQTYCVAGVYDWTNSVITSLTPKTPFHAVDYNDFSDLKDTVDNDVVNLTGNQNISGTKTFTETVVVTGAPINFVAQNNAIVKGVTPTANLYCGYDFRGANGVRLAYLGIRYGIDGGKVLELQRLDTNLTRMNSAFPISTPTPAIADNSTIVATTAFVKSNLNNIPHIIETYVNGTSWYRVYSDGWCEQGGHWNSSSNSLQTITLLKPYKDTNYNVQVTVAHTGAPYTSGAAPMYFSAAYKTVSSFQCYGYSDASLANKDWMACGYIS